MVDVKQNTARKRAPRMTYSQDLRDKIDLLVSSLNQTNMNIVELKTSVSGRLDLLEKRQDAFEKREEERRKAEEQARNERPERAWSRFGAAAAILGILVSNVIAVLAYVHPH